jgi:hypothetical protein
MDPIALEDLALLDVLRRIDAAQPLESDGELLPRLVESGLIEDEGQEPRLTIAGVELCKSLQHRVAADAQAAKILEEREAAEAAEVEAVEPGGALAGDDVPEPHAADGNGRSHDLEASPAS